MGGGRYACFGAGTDGVCIVRGLFDFFSRKEIFGITTADLFTGTSIVIILIVISR